MPQPYAELSEGVTLDPPSGGRIRSGGDVYPAGALFGTPTGASFGPLLLSVPTGGQVEIAELTFLPSDDDGGLLVFGSVAVAAGTAGVNATNPDRDDPSELKQTVDESNTRTSRRALMALGLAAIGGALAGPTASADDGDDDELVTLEIAEFEVPFADSPFSLTVVDAVADVLPPTTDVLVDASGSRVGSISDVGGPVSLSPDVEGVTVYLRDSRGRIAQLLAWASSLLPEDDSLTFARTFPGDSKASDYDPDEFVRLTEHPAIIRPVEESGPGATSLTIGQTAIPHVDDADETEVGAWGLVGGALVYEVGTNPPASEDWELTTRLGPVQRYLQ